MLRGAVGWVLALLVLALPHAASADSLPFIVNVTLDAQNHAVVAWTKLSSQGSTNVKWTKDGTDGAPWGDGSYGTPLADCEEGLRPNTAGDSTWLYGRSCKGDDVANAATRHVTREVMRVGVYYFQVSVNGDRDHASGRLTSFAPHFSGVFKLTVTPGKEGGQTGPTENEVNEELKTIGEAVVTGKAIVHEGPLEKGKPVTGALTIREFYEIDTRTAPAKLTFKDGSVLALDKRSTVTFSGVGFTVERGRVWYSVKGSPRVFFKRVFAGGGGVVEPRAATFSIETLRPFTSARVRVYKGTVTVAQLGSYPKVTSRTRVGPGFESVLEDKHAPTKPRKRTPEPSFWK